MMNSVMADFVSQLGPGQIIDRYSLVYLPTGFAKVIIYNSKSNLFVCITEFKEGPENHSLDIKTSVKGFLTAGGHVIEGYSIANDRIQGNALDHDIQVLKFDKCSPGMNRVPTKGGKSFQKFDEILQICIYALKRNKKRKSFLGMAHIAVDSINSSNAFPYSVEAWYKVFPQSSFLAGYPIVGATNHHVNPPSPVPSPTSETSNNIVSMFVSLSCEDSQDDNENTSPCPPDRNGLPRKNSFSQIAGLMVKLIQKRKNSQRNLVKRSSSSVCSSSSMTDYHGNRSSVTNSISLVSQCGDSSNEEGSDCCFDRIEETIDEKRNTPPWKSRKKWIFSKRISFSNSTKKHESKFQRSEEIICDNLPYNWQAPSTITETPDEQVESYVHDSLHEINTAKAESFPYKTDALSHTRKFHSVESDNGDISSPETEDVSSNGSFEKSKDNGRCAVKGKQSLRSIVHSVHEKAKAKSLPLHSTAPRLSKWKTSFKSKQRNPNEDNSMDPDYAFLKNLQKLSFQTTSKSTEVSEKSDDLKSNDATNSFTESLPDNSATSIADVAKDTETKSDPPAEVHCKVSLSTESCSALTEHSSVCKEKRSLFSQRRGTAFENNNIQNEPHCSKLSVSSQFTEQSSNRSSVKVDSDDEYLSCNERLSNSNSSTVSIYTTVSESSAHC